MGNVWCRARGGWLGDAVDIYGSGEAVTRLDYTDSLELLRKKQGKETGTGGLIGIPSWLSIAVRTRRQIGARADGCVTSVLICMITVNSLRSAGSYRKFTE